jgi:hypothetical protein
MASAVRIVAHHFHADAPVFVPVRATLATASGATRVDHGVAARAESFHVGAKRLFKRRLAHHDHQSERMSVHIQPAIECARRAISR